MEGGSHFLKVNNYSLSRMLSVVYPEKDWQFWKFTRSPKFVWDDVKNQRKYLDWAGKELGIKEMNDWYKVTAKVKFSSEKKW